MFKVNTPFLTSPNSGITVGALSVNAGNLSSNSLNVRVPVSKVLPQM